MSHNNGTVLVTGANGGLGSAIAYTLSTDAAYDCVNVFAVRDPSNATHLKSVLRNALPTRKSYVLGVDLSSIEEVRRFCAEINVMVSSGEIPPIKALILNAGYLEYSSMTLSKDGFDMTWQVNYLANHLLCLLLLQSMDKEKGRVLLISSNAHDLHDRRSNIGGFNPFLGKWEKFPGPKALALGEWSSPQDDSSRISGYRRYGASKLCAVMLMHELATRLSEEHDLSKIKVFGLDPGGMGTNIARRGNGLVKFIMSYGFHALGPISVWYNPDDPDLRTTQKSALDCLRLCFQEEGQVGKVQYFNGTVALETAAYAHNEEYRRDVWRFGLEAANLTSHDTVLTRWQ